MTPAVQLASAAMAAALMVKMVNRPPKQACSRCRMRDNEHEKSCPFHKED